MTDQDNIILSILGVLFVVGIILDAVLLSYLKNRQPQVWQTLGQPSLFLNNSIRNNMSMIKFLWKKEYLGANDSTLNLIARLTYYFGIFYMMFLIGLLILIFFF